MSLNNQPQFKAGGTIAPSRFVVADASADHQVIEPGSASLVFNSATIAPSYCTILGVSQVGMKRTPGLAGSDVTVAAASGDVIQVYSLGDICPVQAGGTIIRGDLVGVNSGTDGKAVSITFTAGTFAGKAVGGIALESATTGQLFLIQVLNTVR